MIFIGWGKKSKKWTVGPNQQIVAVWSFFHILWCPMAIFTTWYLYQNGQNESMVMSYKQVKEIYPINTPKLNQWQRFGLIWTIVVISAISLINIYLKNGA